MAAPFASSMSNQLCRATASVTIVVAVIIAVGYLDAEELLRGAQAYLATSLAFISRAAARYAIRISSTCRSALSVYVHVGVRLSLDAS